MFAELLILASATASLPNAPVQNLDVPRYMGTWHEIARLPQKFQKQCVGDVTASYKQLSPARLQVTNACRKADGSMSVAVGEAKTTNVAAGALKVRFAPKWLSWVGAVWGDYWIVDLDADYRWVVIGSPDKNYMWILSRDKNMPAEQLATLKARAAARGYAVDKLIRSAPGA
jgi:apolipoprotein D and lipocalin family protein